MAILTHLTYEEATALPNPKHIKLEDGRCIVDTSPLVEPPYTNVVNVKDFCAKGTGQVDDWTAIQDAVNYAVLKGVTLYFPTGIYLISKPVVVTGKWSFLGEGTFSRIRVTDTTIPAFIFDINASTVTNAYIGNLHFVGPISSVATSCALKFTGNNTALIQHCTFNSIWCTDFNAFVKDEKVPRTTFICITLTPQAFGIHKEVVQVIHGITSNLC